MRGILLLSLIAATSSSQEITPNEGREIERKALAARRAIRSGDVTVVVEGQRAGAGGTRSPAADLRFVWSGEDIRYEVRWRPGPVRQLLARVGNQHIDYIDEHEKPGQPLTINVTDLGVIEMPAEKQRIVDPRMIGLVPNTLQAFYRYTPDSCILARDEKSLDAVERATIDGTACVRISRTLLDGARCHIWIDPSRPGAVLRVEKIIDRDSKRFVSRIDSTYLGDSRSGVWFPSATHLTMTELDQVVVEEHCQITAARLNEPIDPRLLSMADMAIPAGSAISKRPGGGDLLQWDGSRIVPIRESGGSNVLPRAELLIVAGALSLAAAALLVLALRRGTPRHHAP